MPVLAENNNPFKQPRSAAKKWSTVMADQRASQRASQQARQRTSQRTSRQQQQEEEEEEQGPVGWFW